MNEVIKQLYDRKSVHAFTDDPIDEAADDALIAAQNAVGLRTRDEPLRKGIS